MVAEGNKPTSQPKKATKVDVTPGSMIISLRVLLEKLILINT